MGVGAGFCMYDIVVNKFTFAISSPFTIKFPKLSMYLWYRFPPQLNGGAALPCEI